MSGYYDYTPYVKYMEFSMLKIRRKREVPNYPCWDGFYFVWLSQSHSGLVFRDALSDFSFHEKILNINES